MMQQHYVVFYHEGIIVADQYSEPIDSWDVDTALKIWRSKTLGSKPFCFKFITKARTDEELDSKVVQESSMYFLGGRVLDLQQVKREMPTEHILISNMEGNNWNKVIDTPRHRIQVFPEGSVVLNVMEQA